MPQTPDVGTHTWLGFKPCGCVAVLIADLPWDQKWVGHEVGNCIADGYRMERIPNTELKPEHYGRCTHGKGQMLLEVR